MHLLKIKVKWVDNLQRKLQTKLGSQAIVRTYMDRPEFKLNSDIVKLLLNNILSYIKIGVKSLALIGGETLI